jgi:hypothetical protein
MRCPLRLTLSLGLNFQACKPSYHSFRHVPHPSIGPMAYASNFGMMFGGFGMSC